MVGGRPSIDVIINGFQVRCLLDTGAKTSVIKQDLLSSLGQFKINEIHTKIKYIVVVKNIYFSIYRKI